MAKGLRNFNNFITNEFSLGQTHTNLFKNNNDVYINIPMIKKDNICPIDISLIYTNDGTILSPNYGRGFIPSFLFYITKSGNTFTIKYPDRFEISYSYNSESGTYVTNFNETFVKVEENKTFLYLEDGSYYAFDVDGDNDIATAPFYPMYFADTFENQNTFTLSGNNLTISCYKNVNILFENNNSISVVNKSGTVIYQYVLSYSSYNLISLTYKRNDVSIELVRFTYQNNLITSINDTSQNKTITFTYNSDNKCINIIDNKEKSNLSITYDDYHTKVINEREEENDYYFDSNGYLTLFKDHKNHFNHFSFSSLGKLLSKSRTMISDDHTTNKINLLYNGDFLNGLNGWASTNGYTYTLYNDTSAYFGFSTKAVLLVQDSSAYEGIYQDINIEGNALDTFSIFLFYKSTALLSGCNIELEVYYNNELKETISKPVISSLFSSPSLLSPVSLEFKVSHSYTKLRVKLLSKKTTILNTVSSTYISSIHFIKGGLITNNTYENGILIKEKKNNKTIRYSYYPRTNKRGRVIANVDTSTHYSTFNADERGNFTEIDFNANQKIEINRNSKGDILSSKTFSKDKVLAAYNTYSNDLLVTQEDENGYIKNYSFNLNNLSLNSITFNNFKTVFAYNDKDLIESSRFLYNNVEISTYSYGYRYDYQLSYVEVEENQTFIYKYDYVYDNNDLLISVRHCSPLSLSLTAYEYESSDFYPRYIEKKIYGDNEFLFVYSLDLLTGIKYNNNIY